jgi:hypothetical protein
LQINSSLSRDITLKKKKAEFRIKKSEERRIFAAKTVYSQIFLNIPDEEMYGEVNKWVRRELKEVIGFFWLYQ